MKRRNFVKNSVLGAGALAFTPVSSLFAQKSPTDKLASDLNLAALDPSVTKHYAKFSDEFFAGLPENARNDSRFQDVILPAKTIGYNHDSKGYQLTFLNRKGNTVSFISKKGNQYTLIKNS